MRCLLPCLVFSRRSHTLGMLPPLTVLLYSSSGIISQRIIYTHSESPPKSIKSRTTRRTSDDSSLKYFAIPPHTPQSFLSVADLYNRFFIFIPSFFFDSCIFLFPIYHKLAEQKFQHKVCQHGDDQNDKVIYAGTLCQIT